MTKLLRWWSSRLWSEEQLNGGWTVFGLSFVTYHNVALAETELVPVPVQSSRLIHFKPQSSDSSTQRDFKHVCSLPHRRQLTLATLFCGVITGWLELAWRHWALSGVRWALAPLQSGSISSMADELMSGNHSELLLADLVLSWTRLHGSQCSFSAAASCGSRLTTIYRLSSQICHETVELCLFFLHSGFDTEGVQQVFGLAPWFGSLHYSGILQCWHPLSEYLMYFWFSQDLLQRLERLVSVNSMHAVISIRHSDFM